MSTRLLSTAVFLLSACAPSGPHKPVDGEVSGSGEVTYDQVRPIFAERCAACHPARSGPNWLEYQQAKTYAENGRLMERAVRARTMPPPGSPQAASITERERRTIGRWVDSGAPRAAGSVGPGPQPAGGSLPEVVGQQCVHCHGSGEPTAQPKIPRLAGQNGDYMYAQLQRFKWRRRIDWGQAMNDVALTLSEDDMRSAVAYYSTRVKTLSGGPPPPLSARAQAAFDLGQALARQNCVACHMNPDNGNLPNDPSIPVLAGQAREYLMSRLIFFRSGGEAPTTDDDNGGVQLMREMAKLLSDQDIEALATYFSSVRNQLPIKQ